MKNFSPKTYHLIFFSLLFSFLIPSISFASCASVPLRGDYTVSAGCTFPTHSNIGGVDNGSITINDGQTLTVNPGQTIAWGPGKSLIISEGGSLAIADGGQLKQGRICRVDADADGYVTTDAPTVALTCTGLIAQSDIDVSLTIWDDVTYDYNDSSDTVYPGTVCGGDCSTNDSTGACVAVSAGENSFAACQRCNGSSLAHVNITDNTQDTEGSNVCSTTCKTCNGSGSCVDQGSGEDLFSHCSTFDTCTSYIYGWSGNNCAKYSGSSSNNGDCNGSGACYTSVADSCSGIGATSASCGSSGCLEACVANAAATSYDTVAEVCYQADQHSCSADYVCNASGTCEEVIFCSGDAGDHNTTKTVSGGLVYCDNSDRLWTPTQSGAYNWVNGISKCSGLTYAGYSDWVLPSCVSKAANSSCILYQFGIDACGGYSCTPAWDTTARANGYWSSTEDGSDFAWQVYFSNGGVYINYKYYGFYVRCVRGQ